MSEQELTARRNWAGYMSKVHNEHRKAILRSTYDTLCEIMADTLDRSTTSVLMTMYEVKDWRGYCEYTMQERKVK